MKWYNIKIMRNEITLGDLDIDMMHIIDTNQTITN
jgi:hypothetical protein